MRVKPFMPLLVPVVAGPEDDWFWLWGDYSSWLVVAMLPHDQLLTT